MAMNPEYLGLKDRLERELQEAERKGWDSLGRYKFQQFGYWAAIWVHLNRVGDFNKPNPWSRLVKTAKEHQERRRRTEHNDNS